ncbi:unnamed protein product [Schistocephalus solidus]|uniref:FYVE-type domain-containing protein n=1 Tax=Schistocephalus solidus TaxID=70667 RepID=A0A183TNH4_SCHSO|nr:unnamed protein product [Schistocephalus solidus]
MMGPQLQHHCRNCGRVVCGKCSQYRWVLPSQCPNQVRVCADCHEKLRAEQLAEKAKAHQAPTDPLRPTAGVAALQAMPPSSAASINHSGLPEFAPPSWNPKLLGDSDDDPHSESSSDISGLADQIADSRYLSVIKWSPMSNPIMLLHVPSSFSDDLRRRYSSFVNSHLSDGRACQIFAFRQPETAVS